MTRVITSIAPAYYRKTLWFTDATPWFKAGQDGRYVLNDPKTLMSPAANLPPVRSGGRHAYDGL
jgi:hypothetical protein